MRPSIFLWVLLALALGGCVTLSQPELDVLQQHRVSPLLLARMEHRERLSLPDIIELAERHVPTPFVVHYLRSTYAVYRLNTEDVLILRRAGVSHEVIDFLLTTPSLFAPQYDSWWYGDDLYWWGYPPLYVGFGHEHEDHHHH